MINSIGTIIIAFIFGAFVAYFVYDIRRNTDDFWFMKK